eukprot:14179-Ditylum_brightwellii.AAC.1
MAAMYLANHLHTIPAPALSPAPTQTFLPPSQPQPESVTSSPLAQPKKQKAPWGLTNPSSPSNLSPPDPTPTPIAPSATSLSKWQQHSQKEIDAFWFIGDPQLLKSSEFGSKYPNECFYCWNLAHPPRNCPCLCCMNQSAQTEFDNLLTDPPPTPPPANP